MALVENARENWEGDSANHNTILVAHVNVCRKKGKLGAYAMKRVAAGIHLSTSWLFEPAKRQDDRADYCLETRR